MVSHRYGPIRTWVRANRNMVLFIAMLAIMVLLPAFEDTRSGEILFAGVNTLIVIVSVAANGRSRLLFKVALGLVVPAVLLRAAAVLDDRPVWLTWSWVFCAAVMVVTIMRLLREMFEPGPVNRERLFACATTYLVIGLLWCYLFAICEELSPRSFSGLSAARSLHVSDMAYFSYNIVTNVALTPALPVSKLAQMLVLLEEFASVLYMAFVISRLVGMYAPTPKEPREHTPPAP